MLHIWIEIKMGLVLKADKYLYFRKENDLMKDKEFDEYLDINSKKYIQDKYSMSLRELMTMYQNEEINSVPIYQRLFRWSGEQASKLIESIMLGIPLPPIFVSVRNGKWEVIDGVQRISSILWFYGNLVDENHKNPLVLSNLEILRELNGKTYNQLKKEYPNSLFKFFDIKRIDVNLLVSENIESEYTLFNRLNTGGISLSAQEIRNFLISKLNNKFYEEIKDFKDSKLCSLYEPIIFAVKNKNKYTFNYQDILVETKTGAKRKLIDYRKSPPAPYNDKKVPGNVWHFPRVRFKMEEYVEHPSQKPEILLERIVKVSSNESSVVLDLFAGSFSLGRVCKRLNRNYIGIEKSAEYSKLGNLRLK